MGFEQQDWVMIFKGETPHGELRIAGLLRLEGVERALDEASFDHASGYPGFVISSDPAGGLRTEYLTVRAGEEVPLVFHRYFNGTFPEVVENGMLACSEKRSNVRG